MALWKKLLMYFIAFGFMYVLALGVLFIMSFMGFDFGNLFFTALMATIVAALAVNGPRLINKLKEKK